MVSDVLIVKMSSLGDIIHAFPVVEYIRARHPEANIDWVVERPFAPLVQAHPAVRRVLTVHTKKWRSQLFHRAIWREVTAFYHELRDISYPIILDLQGNVKSGWVTASAKGRVKVGFGYASVPEWPNLLATHQRINPPAGRNIREDYLFLAKSAFDDFTPVEDKGVRLKLTEQETKQLAPILEHCGRLKGVKLLICSGSNWPNKQLSRESLEGFLKALIERMPDSHCLFAWGSQAEKDLADQVAALFPSHCFVVDKLSLPALQNLMVAVDIVFAMDSLPLHLAGTTDTPTFSIFGASAAEKYKPIGHTHHALQGACPYKEKFEKRCRLLRTCQTGACVKQLDGKREFDKIFDCWS